jgi:cytochrome c5
MAVRVSLPRQRAVALALLVSFALVGCRQKGADGGGAASVVSAAVPATVISSDPAIQKIYDTSCRTCHGVPASGAPQAGDVKTWAPRAAQGKDVLIDHAINGFKGMPPMGMCPQCSEKDFVALIEMMSGASLK